MVNIRLRTCAGCTSRKPSSRDRACDKSQWPHSPNTSSPELLRYGKGIKLRPSKSVPLRTTWVPEPERLRPGRCMRPRASLRWSLAEQPRAWAGWTGRAHVPWAGAGPVWLSHCEHTPVLFVCRVPPSPQSDWTSEPKKSVHHRPLWVRAEIRHWRDQQTEEAKQKKPPWKWQVQ